MLFRSRQKEDANADRDGVKENSEDEIENIVAEMGDSGNDGTGKSASFHHSSLLAHELRKKIVFTGIPSMPFAENQVSYLKDQISLQVQTSPNPEAAAFSGQIKPGDKTKRNLAKISR